MISTNTHKRKAPPLSNTRNNAARTSGSAIHGEVHATLSTSNNPNNPNSYKTNSSTNNTKIKHSQPTTLTINSIPIHFPFTPYDVQTKYMKSVLDALGSKDGGQHALLESPTVSKRCGMFII